MVRRIGVREENVREKPGTRFLMIPELGQAERWTFVGVMNNPFFKNGPFLQWNSNQGRTAMINRQLLYMEMTGRMENGDGEHGR